MTDNGQPKKPSASEEALIYTKNESVRVLEMIYEQQGLETIRCPSCQFPHVLTNLVQNELGMVYCDGCSKSFYVRSDNSSSSLPEIDITSPGIREYGTSSDEMIDFFQIVSVREYTPVYVMGKQGPVVSGLNPSLEYEFFDFDYPVVSDLVVSGLIVEPRPENAIIGEDTEDEE